MLDGKAYYHTIRPQVIDNETATRFFIETLPPIFDNLKPETWRKLIPIIIRSYRKPLSIGLRVNDELVTALMLVGPDDCQDWKRQLKDSLFMILKPGLSLRFNRLWFSEPKYNFRYADLLFIASHPQHRGLGYARRIMQPLPVLCRRVGGVGAKLQTRIPGFFEKYGFKNNKRVVIDGQEFNYMSYWG